MTVKIRKHLVSKDVASRVTYGKRNPINYIVIHETANTSKGADADAHGRLQANGNSRSASWHYTVDDKEAVQSFNDRAQCWHAGSRKYNEQSIGIEICVNEGGNFKKAVENAAELTRQLMRKYNVPASRVIQHNQASGKDCPTFLRRGSKGILWSDFLAMVKGGDATKVAPKKTTASKPKTQVKNSSAKAVAKLKVDGKWGSATTRELQRALGTTADGIISSQPRNSITQALYGGVTFGSKGSPMVRALQRKVGAKVDGKLGAETIRKLQAYLGTVRDGKLSRPSLVVKELQRRLNNGKF